MSNPDKPNEHPDYEQADLEQARTALLEALLKVLPPDFPREQMTALTLAVRESSSFDSLILMITEACAREGLELDVFAVLREQGILEDEGPGLILETGPVATDEAPETMVASRAERAVILLRYGDLITASRREELLSTHFMEGDSLELNFYRAVVWSLAEPLISSIFEELKVAEGKPASQRRLRALKKQAEEEAITQAKRKLKIHGIEEPSQ